jgi:hypothetical protein
MHAKKNPARQNPAGKWTLPDGVWRGAGGLQSRQTLSGGEWRTEADTEIMPRRRGLPRKG